MRAGHVGLVAGAGMGIAGLVYKARGREVLGNFLVGGGVIVGIGSLAALSLDESDYAAIPYTPPNRRFPRAGRQS